MSIAEANVLLSQLLIMKRAFNLIVQFQKPLKGFPTPLTLNYIKTNKFNS